MKLDASVLQRRGTPLSKAPHAAISQLEGHVPSLQTPQLTADVSLMEARRCLQMAGIPPNFLTRKAEATTCFAFCTQAPLGAQSRWQYSSYKLFASFCVS